jgi:hypothetical protein
MCSCASIEHNGMDTVEIIQFLSTKIQTVEFRDLHYINPLNAELNPIYHLLILLGDLTFMGLCIVSIF